MNAIFYILNEKGEPKIEHIFDNWSEWFKNNDTHVADEWVDDVRVSTVFLGLDHKTPSQKSPVLWETVIFGGQYDQEMSRCSGSREQAEAMHFSVVNKIKTLKESVK